MNDANAIDTLDRERRLLRRLVESSISVGGKQSDIDPHFEPVQERQAQ
jgi:hypothetical protein